MATFCRLRLWRSSQQGKQNDVATLTGANKDELGGFGPPQGPVTVESFAKQARQRYGEAADGVFEALSRPDG